MSLADLLVCDPQLIEERDYWLERLAERNGAAGLVLEQKRREGRDTARAELEVEIGADLYGKMRKLSGESDFLLYAVLVAGLKVCLQRYVGGRRIAVGSPALLDGGRENAVALTDVIEPGQSFRSLLLQVRETMLEAYKRQRYPIGRLLQDLSREGETLRCDLFDVALGLEGLHGAMPEVGQDLTIRLAKGGGELSGRIRYQAGLYERRWVERFWRHYRRLLEVGVDETERVVAGLEMLLPEERCRMVEEMNRTEVEYDGRGVAHEWFEEQVTRTPWAIAVSSEIAQISYVELNDRANRLAWALRERGVGPEQLVAICLERSIELVTAILGVLKAGAAYVPIDPDYPAERVAYVLRDAGVAVVVSAQGMMDESARKGHEVFWIENLERVGEQRRENPCSGVNRDHPAYVIYTSGSTGRPKGVVISHGALSNHMEWMRDHLGEGGGLRVVQKTAVSFDASVWEFYAPLLVGGRLIMAEPGGHRDSRYLVRLIEEQEATVLQLAPSMMRVMAEEELLERCVSLKRLCCGGEVLEKRWARRWSERLEVEIDNLYGPTETTIDATCGRYERGESEGAVPIGVPISNMRAYVLDELGELAPEGVVGELYLGGAGLGRGYRGKPGLTAERFLPDDLNRRPGERLYRTGDLVRYNEEGQLEYLGRGDQQIKLRGHRIELGEIEAALMGQPGVAAAVVALKQGARGEGRLVGYVVEEEGVELRVEHLREELLKQLPDYMAPGSLMVLEQMPLLPNGKIDRRRLPEPELMKKEGGQERARTPVEQLLTDLWEEALGLREIGIDDNLFELGGDSILSIQIVARANCAGLRLTPKQVFDHQTIRQLGEVAEASSFIRRTRQEARGEVALTPTQR